MGDYRYFPDQPAPVRGRDPYGHAPAEHRPHADLRPDPRRYAPAAQDRSPYPYDAPDDGDFDYSAHAPDPYAPPLRAAPSAPQGHPSMRVDYAPPPFGHHGYGAPQRGAVPSWVGPQGAHAAPAPRAPAPMVPPLRPAALLHGLGAVMSLGLVVLAGAWTWNMMQRDVSGVPVVRALEGPMRVAPETPGGQQAAFQGLAINELAGAGTSSQADEIVLAPPPVGLGGLSAPQPNVATLPDIDQAPVPAGPALGFNTPNRLAVAKSPRPRGRDASGVQMAAAAPQAPAAQMPALSTSNDASAADSLAESIAQSVALDLAGPRGIDVDPASIGPGTRLVQLGAYDNATEARSAWDALSRRFSPLLNDRGRVIEAAHSGGSVFYRLRAHGFSDERDARRFCAALVAEQIDCIPVLVR